jgi:hypothetical protein
MKIRQDLINLINEIQWALNKTIIQGIEQGNSSSQQLLGWIKSYFQSGIGTSFKVKDALIEFKGATMDSFNDGDTYQLTVYFKHGDDSFDIIIDNISF